MNTPKESKKKPESKEMSKKQRVCTYQMRIRIVCTSFVIGII